MYAEERHQDIITILRARRKVSVAELSDRYSVTKATIRADLKVLEEGGLIVKTHGGALLKTQNSFELSSDTRKSINQDRKAIIGELAAGLVNDNETIIIDTGTTAACLAEHLIRKKSLTVITNDFEVARTLEDGEDVQIIFLGGLIKNKYHCSYHSGDHSLLSTLRVDKAFMAANSFSLVAGASVADLKLAECKRIMVRQANEVLLLCDSTKIGKTSLAQFATPEQIDIIVTDERPEEAERYREQGISLIIP